MKSKRHVFRAISSGVALLASAFVCSSLSIAGCPPNWVQGAGPSQTLTYDITYTNAYPSYLPNVACTNPPPSGYAGGAVTSGQTVYGSQGYSTCIYAEAQVQGTCQVYNSVTCQPDHKEWDAVNNVGCAVWPASHFGDPDYVQACGWTVFLDTANCSDYLDKPPNGTNPWEKDCQTFNAHVLADNGDTLGTTGPMLEETPIAPAGPSIMGFALATNPSACDAQNPPAYVWKYIAISCDTNHNCTVTYPYNP
jgi:hypothetical protein